MSQAIRTLRDAASNTAALLDGLLASADIERTSDIYVPWERNIQQAFLINASHRPKTNFL